MVHLAGMIIRLLFFFSGAFFLLWYYLKHAAKPAVPAATAGDEAKAVMPLRLQAYERFVLFLERIHPSNLLMRLNSPGISAGQLQSLLVKTIREEFEYNLSQQLYISVNAWELVKNAKEETISMINQATARVGQEASASELVREVFESSITRGQIAVDVALDAIKKEVQRFF